MAISSSHSCRIAESLVQRNNLPIDEQFEPVRRLIRCLPISSPAACADLTIYVAGLPARSILQAPVANHHTSRPAVAIRAAYLLPRPRLRFSEKKVFVRILERLRDAVEPLRRG